MKERVCKNCKYSRWHLTKTGRISLNSVGECVVQLPVVVLPISVTKAYGYHEWRKVCISQDDSDCPLYEERDGKHLPIQPPRIDLEML